MLCNLLTFRHITNTLTFTNTSKDSIVRNLDFVIRLSKRLSDIQSLEYKCNNQLRFI